MAWSGVEVGTEWHVRGDFGRFRAVLDESGRLMAKSMVDKYAKHAQENAPSGPPRQDYARRPKLKTSISPVMISSRSGVAVARTGHAGAIEKGGTPHKIPNAFGRGITVDHPGNDPQPYLRPAYEQLRQDMIPLAERAYPY